MSKNNDNDLNGKTPKWFRDWHFKQFIPVKRTTNSNKKWIYVIMAAIITAAVTGNFDLNGIAKCIAGIINGGG